MAAVALLVAAFAIYPMVGGTTQTQGAGNTEKEAAADDTVAENPSVESGSEETQVREVISSGRQETPPKKAVSTQAVTKEVGIHADRGASTPVVPASSQAEAVFSSTPVTSQKTSPVLKSSQPTSPVARKEKVPVVRSVPTPRKAEKETPQSKKILLFDTIEFKGKIRKLPKWSRVLAKMKAWKGYFKDAQSAKLPSRSGWVKLRRDVAGLDRMGRLKAVNKFFNKWPYRLDAANYGASDYWATPMEFLRKSGDCEDYSIAKFYALQELGFTGDSMRIVALKDRIRNIGHAVLVVYLGNDAYVLDNQTNMVLSHVKYKHYVPQYSVNEHFRWMHVPRSKKSVRRSVKKK